jgi:hypothetical protein
MSDFRRLRFAVPLHRFTNIARTTRSCQLGFEKYIFGSVRGLESDLMSFAPESVQHYLQDFVKRR